MAGQIRNDSNAVASETQHAPGSPAALLATEPWRFAFFQAVRLLEKVTPGRGVPGGEARPSDETVRIRPIDDLIFPPSDIQSLRLPSAGERGDMVVRFFGLTGPMGVMPYFWTEAVAKRRRQGEEDMREFLDVFNHRLASLFFRAWEKYRLDRSIENRVADRYAAAARACAGFGTPGMAEALSLHPHALAFYSGLLRTRPRSASAAQAVLQDYFEVPVSVDQFVPVRRPMPDDMIVRCGGANSQAGSAFRTGTRLVERASTVRFRIGPLAYHDFVQFLPTGNAWRPLNEFARLLVGADLDIRFRLILDRTSTPSLTARSDAHGARSGWTAFAFTRRMPHDGIVDLRAADAQTFHSLENSHA